MFLVSIICFLGVFFLFFKYYILVLTEPIISTHNFYSSFTKFFDGLQKKLCAKKRNLGFGDTI